MKLKICQLDELARIAAGSDKPLSRKSNKEQTAERLRKLLKEKFNDDDAWYNSLLSFDAEDEQAFEALRLDLAEETGQELPTKLVPVGQQTKPIDKPAAPVRAGKFGGMRLYPAQLVDAVGVNPRRLGTAGWHAYNIIISQPGITYEEYKKQGGAVNHLNWDWERHQVIVRDKDGVAIVHDPEAPAPDDADGSDRNDNTGK